MVQSSLGTFVASMTPDSETIKSAAWSAPTTRTRTPSGSRRGRPQIPRVARVRIRRLQSMEVAAAERNRPSPRAQLLVPPPERNMVEPLPPAVPHFDGVESDCAGVLPGWTERFGMVDRHERATCRRRLHRATHRVRVGLAEFPPAIGAPRVPHFDGVESDCAGELPGWTERFGMVDRHERATCRRRLHRATHRVRVGLAEFPPAI